MGRTVGAALRLSAVAVLVLAGACRMSHAASMLVDFTGPQALDAWVAVNDGVMGGVSTGRLVAGDGFASFTGTVSFENNGGFASVRTRPGSALGTAGDGTGLAAAARIEAFELTVRGDGKRYRLTLRMEDEPGAVQYQASFTAPPEWSTLRLGVAEFRPRFRGRDVPGAPPLDPRQVRVIGFLIADRQEGPFRLDVREVRARP